MKQESVAEKKPNYEPANDPIDENSSPAAAPKAPSLNSRIQDIILNGTPEELEAEVATCHNFLSDTRKPMEEFVGQNKDARHWVQQLGRLVTFLFIEPD